MFTSLILFYQINIYINSNKENMLYFSYLEKIISGLIVGFILLAIGFLIFKNQKRYQILKEKEIEYEIKLFAFKKKFKHYKEKYSKKLTSDMFGGEDKIYHLYSELKEIINFREYYNIKDNVNLYHIMNCLYYKFLILESNNRGPKKYYNDIIWLSEEFEGGGLKVKKDSKLYLKEYNFHNEKVEELIKNGFLK